MDKISDRLDYVDNGIDMYNYYIQIEMQKIRDEIMWMDCNSNNIHELRLYFVNFLGKERVSQLSDKAINELLTIRANELYKHYQILAGQKNDTTPLKIIVQALKLKNI